MRYTVESLRKAVDRMGVDHDEFVVEIINGLLETLTQNAAERQRLKTELWRYKKDWGKMIDK